MSLRQGNLVEDNEPNAANVTAAEMDISNPPSDSMPTDDNLTDTKDHGQSPQQAVNTTYSSKPAADMSILKLFGVMLKADASNMESYLYKMEKIFIHKNLMPAVVMHFDDIDSEEGKLITANPFTDRHMLPQLAQLSHDEVDTYIKTKAIDPAMVQTAHTLITITVPDALLHIYRNYPAHAAVTIARIREHFSPTDIKTVHELYNKINHCKLTQYGGDFGKMSEELKTCSYKLQQLGENVTERYLVGRLLDGLVPHGKYTVIRSIIEQQGDVPFSAAVASINSYIRSNTFSKKNTPITVESSMKLTDQKSNKNDKYKNSYHNKKLRAKAALRKMATRRKRQEQRLRNLGDKLRFKKFKHNCNTCGKPGHKSQDCWHNKNKSMTCRKCGKKGHHAKECFTGRSYAGRQPRLRALQEELTSIKNHLKNMRDNQIDFTRDNHQEDREILNMMVETDDHNVQSNTLCSPRVVFDSGASSMFFNDPSFFITLNRIPKKKILTGKSDSTMTAEYQGNIPLLLDDGTGVFRRMLIKALYVPEAPENYFSQLVIDDHGCETRCKQGLISIYYKGKKIAFAKKSGKAYYLQCKMDRQETSKNEHLATLSISPLDLHNALGHFSPGKLKDTVKVTKGLNVKGTIPKSFRCLACDLAKTKRMSFIKSNFKLASSNAHRVHSDVKFPISTSLRGYKGFVVYLFEGSRHLTVSLIKKKSDVEEKSILFIKRAQTRKHPLNEFRSDGGGEYLSNYFQEFLTDNGISMSRSTPRSPEQNGKSERIIQTLMSMTRSMIKHAGLPDGYWCYALECAVYIYNRSSHSSLPRQTSPYEAHYNVVPNLDNLVPFGCIGVSANDPAERPPGGLGDRGRLIRMLAYDVRHKTYIVCDRNPKHVLRRRITKWYKDRFTFPPESDSKKNSTGLIAKSPGATTKSLGATPSHQPPLRPKRSSVTQGLPKLSFFDLQAQRDAIANANKSMKKLKLSNKIAKLGCLSTEDAECILQTSTVSVHDIEDVPKNFKDAMSRPDKDKWQEAHRNEMQSFLDNKVFKIVSKPKDVKTVRCRWVYKKKVSANGSIKYKARLVACGYNQQYGINYFETYTPTLALSSFRILLAISSAKRLNIHSIDVNTAFLTGPLDCVVYMDLPPGLDASMLSDEDAQALQLDSACLLLRKGVYGLVQAGNMYWNHFKRHMVAHGFKCIYSDPCVLIKKLGDRIIIIACYVDDINILYKNPSDLQWCMKTIGKLFKFKNLGDISLCLGLQIGRLPNGCYHVSQTTYIERMAEKFGITPNKRCRTPLPSKNLMEYSQSPTVNASHYRSLIGAILYTSVATRPDISFAISYLAQFSQDPREIHLDAAMHLLGYLANTSNYKILYDGKIRTPGSFYIENNKDGNLTLGFCDASFHPDPTHGKSVSGFLVFLHGGPVCWRKVNQKIVTTSSAEAEYVAMSAACREIIFVRQLCDEIGFQESFPTDLYSDSKSAIAIATNPGFTQRSKSIRLHYHNTRDCVENSVVTLKKINGKLNPADALTKSLNRAETSKYNQYFFNTNVDNTETLSFLEETPVDEPESDDHTQDSNQNDTIREEPIGDPTDVEIDSISESPEAQQPQHPDRQEYGINLDEKSSRVRPRDPNGDENSPSPTRQRREPPTPLTRDGMRCVTNPDHKNYRFFTMPFHSLPNGLRSAVSSVRSTFSTHRLSTLHIGGYRNVQDLLTDSYHLERKIILNIFLSYDDSGLPALNPDQVASAPLAELIPPHHRNFSYITTNMDSLPVSLKNSINSICSTFNLQRQWILDTYGRSSSMREISESYMLERNAIRSLLSIYRSSEHHSESPNPPVGRDSKSTSNHAVVSSVNVTESVESNHLPGTSEVDNDNSLPVIPVQNSAASSRDAPTENLSSSLAFSSLNRSRRWLSDNCVSL